MDPGPCGVLPTDDAAGSATTLRKLQFLRQGVNLGEPGASVECIETHAAWVFLTAHSAYKLRKPVRYRGLDTLSVESRRARCIEELRLNQPLAPGVYREVLALCVGADGSLRLGEGARVIDWLLHMRRLPSARMLDAVIRAGRLGLADIGAIVSHLRTFYAGQPGERMSGVAYCRRLAAQVRFNRDELLASACGLDAASVVSTAQRQLHWIHTHAALLGERAGQGWIRDGHGDLKPEHVCLGPPVRVIDRLDVEADLRLLDPVEDLCFLWLECARLGAPGAGWRLVRRFLADTGSRVPASLPAFYLAHRALGRARLGAWRLAEPDAARAHWRERIDDYVARAAAAMSAASATG